MCHATSASEKSSIVFGECPHVSLPNRDERRLGNHVWYYDCIAHNLHWSQSIHQIFRWNRTMPCLQLNSPQVSISPSQVSEVSKCRTTPSRLMKTLLESDSQSR